MNLNISTTSLFAVLFIALLALLVLLGKLPVTVFILYLGLSLATFVIYWLDKSAARQGKWRTKENTLHLLALAGGWPGALMAQEKLRHKSHKQSFRIIFWITVLVNCGLFIWLLSVDGFALL